MKFSGKTKQQAKIDRKKGIELRRGGMAQIPKKEACKQMRKTVGRLKIGIYNN